MNWEIRLDMYRLPCERQLASGKLRVSPGAQLSALRWPRGVGWGVGWGGGSRGKEYVYPVADSLRCTVETKATM